MFNQIELPEYCKALEQALNILESNLISIKGYIKTPNCPSEPIDGILNTIGLGVGKTIVSSGSIPDIPLRHLKLWQVVQAKNSGRQQDMQATPAVTSFTSQTAYPQAALQLQESGVQVGATTC